MLQGKWAEARDPAQHLTTEDCRPRGPCIPRLGAEADPYPAGPCSLTGCELGALPGPARPPQRIQQTGDAHKVLSTADGTC